MQNAQDKGLDMPAKLLLISAATLTLAGPALAAPPEITAIAQTNVELFSELEACAANPDFEVFGLSSNGPCGDWVTRIEAQQRLDTELAGHGLFNCLAGDIRVAGNSLVSGDALHFDFVSELMEECREDL